MILLDTNVLSELLRPAPHVRVIDWIADQPQTSLFTTTVTQAEILYGIALMDGGKRRDALRIATTAIFNEDLAGRVLPFDGDAAMAYATIAAERRHIGRPISQFDAQIAAICRSRGARLATRNMGDFADTGVELINPFD